MKKTVRSVSSVSNIISKESKDEFDRTLKILVFDPSENASNKATDSSVSAVELSKGYFFPNQIPHKGPTDIRLRVKNLGNHDKNNKRNWMDTAMFIRKMRPCKVIVTPFREVVPIEDIEEIRKKMKDEIITTYHDEKDFIKEEAGKDDFIDYYFNGFEFNKEDYSGVKQVVFLSDLHLCSIGITSEKGLYELFLPIKENFLKAIQFFQNYEEENEDEGETESEEEEEEIKTEEKVNEDLQEEMGKIEEVEENQKKKKKIEEEEEEEGKNPKKEKDKFVTKKKVKKEKEKTEEEEELEEEEGEDEEEEEVKELKSLFMQLDCERKEGFANDDILFVFLGDQVDFGNTAEFLLFKIFLQKMNMKNVCVIPGNHDNSAFFGNFVRSTHQCEKFSKVLLGEENNVLNTHKYYPKEVDVSDATRLILLDSTKVIKKGDNRRNAYHAASGLIGKGQRDELKRLLSKAKDEEKEVIICLHHHPEEGGIVKRLICLNDLVWSLGGDTERFECFVSRLWDATKLLAIIKEFKDVVKDVVFGHLHNPFYKVVNKTTRLRCLGSLTENKWDEVYKGKKGEVPFKNGITCCFNIETKKWTWT